MALGTKLSNYRVAFKLKKKKLRSFRAILRDLLCVKLRFRIFANFEPEWLAFKLDGLSLAEFTISRDDADDIAIMRAHTRTRSGKWSFRCSITRNPRSYFPLIANTLRIHVRPDLHTGCTNGTVTQLWIDRVRLIAACRAAN